MSKSHFLIIVIVVMGLYPTPVFNLFINNKNSYFATHSNSAIPNPKLSIKSVTESRTSSLSTNKSLFTYLNFNITIYDYYTFWSNLSYSLFGLNSSGGKSFLIQSSFIYINPKFEYSLIYIPFSDYLFYNGSSTPQLFELDLHAQAQTFVTYNTTNGLQNAEISLVDTNNHITYTYNPTSWNPNSSRFTIRSPTSKGIDPYITTSTLTQTASSTSYNAPNLVSQLFNVILFFIVVFVIIFFGFYVGHNNSKVIEPKQEIEEPPLSKLDPLLCPNCSEIITQDDIFCANCGRKLK